LPHLPRADINIAVAHYPRTVSISALVILVNIVSGSQKVRTGAMAWGGLQSNLLIISRNIPVIGTCVNLDSNTGILP